jgi:hypothetical protein
MSATTAKTRVVRIRTQRDYRDLEGASRDAMRLRAL